jgi:hypothetical protein
MDNEHFHSVSSYNRLYNSSPFDLTCTHSTKWLTVRKYLTIDPSEIGAAARCGLNAVQGRRLG